MPVKALCFLVLLALVPAAAHAASAGPPPVTPTPIPPPRSASRPVSQAVLLNGKPFPQVTPFVARPPRPVRTLFVSAAKENGDGSEKQPWNDLQAALRELRAGDRLRVLPGTYTGEFRIDEACREGEGARSVIQVFFDGKARLVPRGGAAVFTVRRPFWHFVGILVDLGQSAGAGVSFETQGAHHITFDRARISGGSGPGILVGGESASIRIVNSRIAKSRLKEAAPSAIGVEISAGARDILLARSGLHDNPGGSVVVRAPERDGRPAAKLQIAGNTIHDDAAAAIDVEAAEGLRVTGNTISDAPGDPGTRGVVLGRVHGAVVRGNHVSDCAVAIQVGSRTPGGEVLAADDVVIDRNYLESSIAPGAGVRIEAGRRVRFANNALNRMAEAILVRGSPPGTQSVVVANNLVLAVSKVAFAIEDAGAAAQCDYNVFSSDADAVAVRIGDRTIPASDLRKRDGMGHTKWVRGVRILNGDLARVSGVPTVDEGVPVDGVPFRGRSPDIGVEER